jgi:hypothetical protein
MSSLNKHAEYLTLRINVTEKYWKNKLGRNKYKTIDDYMYTILKNIISPLSPTQM